MIEIPKQMKQNVLVVYTAFLIGCKKTGIPRHNIVPHPVGFTMIVRNEDGNVSIHTYGANDLKANVAITKDMLEKVIAKCIQDDDRIAG